MDRILGVRQIAREISQSVESYILVAERAFAAGQREEAIRSGLKVLARRPGDPRASEILGAAYLSQERRDEAIAVLKAGLSKAPSNAALLKLLGFAHARKAHYKSALACFQKATQIEPDDVTAWENLGKVAYRLRRWDHARAAFEYCRTLDPTNPEAGAALGRLELREGNFSAALALASEVIQHHPKHLMSREVRAEANLRLGHNDQALADALFMVAMPRAGSKMNVLAYGVAAEAAEKLGRFDEAFAHLASMNQAILESHPPSDTRINDSASTESLEEAIRLMPHTARKAATWSRQFDHPAPIFVIGFPRCGTPALHAKLKEHPLIIGAEKRPQVKQLVDMMRAEDSAQQFADMTENQARDFRKTYWDNVAAVGIDVPTGGRTIELKPFYSQHLDAFAQIYPDAKFIFVHRDPRDVVLSCLKSRQLGRRSMYEFSDIERTARYYDVVMRVADAARQAFDLDLFEVAFDDMGADMNGLARRIFKFLDLPCDDRTLPTLSQIGRAHV